MDPDFLGCFEKEKHLTAEKIQMSLVISNTDISKYLLTGISKHIVLNIPYFLFTFQLLLSQITGISK